jgi:hypothetical protein
MPFVKLLPLAVLVFLFALPAARTADAQTLRGSKSSVNRIYGQAINHDLHFYETSAGVRKAAANGTFVHLSGNRDYQVYGVTYPYVLPSTHTFITRLAAQYRATCGEKLVVTSAIRPKSFRLANSVDKSVHPTGMAIDLRKPTRAKCLSWLRKTLLDLEGTGAIEAVEERNPPHFHVAVFPRPYTRYVQGRGGEVKVATRANSGTRASSGGSTASAGTTYRVRRGDSLWGIARRHGTSVQELKQVNEMKGSRIVAGQVLVIPGAR